MNTFTCYSELEGNILQDDDEVIFRLQMDDEEIVCEGVVHLNSYGDFKFIAINFDEITEAFNLSTKWPFWEEKFQMRRGVECLTRMFLHIFELIEEQERLKETSEILFID